MTYRSVIASFVVVALMWSVTPLTHAQAPAVQKAFEEVRTKLDDLVSAKDENLADNLALRIQAFKKVVEFSVEEAKTLKVKLLSTEFKDADKETLEAWRARMEDGLIDADAYYGTILVALTTTTTPLDLPSVKALATSFKEWRDASFTPLSGEVEEFLLVAGQARALEVTEARFAKIAGDVTKLERAKIKGVDTLVTFLSAARTHLDGAANAYRRASALFAATIATSTPPVSTSTPITSGIATSTEPARPARGPTDKEVKVTLTVRDEIRASLESIKQTYLAFIEMSVEVKKILR